MNNDLNLQNAKNIFIDEKTSKHDGCLDERKILRVIRHDYSKQRSITHKNFNESSSMFSLFNTYFVCKTVKCLVNEK
jgi:hypothetical protein